MFPGYHIDPCPGYHKIFYVFYGDGTADMTGMEARKKNYKLLN